MAAVVSVSAAAPVAVAPAAAPATAVAAAALMDGFNERLDNSSMHGAAAAAVS